MQSSHGHGLWKREGGRWILSLWEALGQELGLLSSSGNYRGARQGRAGQEGKCPSLWVLLSQREDMESI